NAQSPLKVISSSLNIAVHGRDLRQDKQRSSRIFALLVQSLLRQLLRRRRIARRQPLLGRDQQLFRSASRNVNNFRSGAAGELHLPCSFSFAANIMAFSMSPYASRNPIGPCSNLASEL